MERNETTEGMRVETKVIGDISITTYSIDDIDLTTCDGEKVMTLGIDSSLLQGTVEELRTWSALINTVLDRFEENTP